MYNGEKPELKILSNCSFRRATIAFRSTMRDLQKSENRYYIPDYEIPEKRVTPRNFSHESCENLPKILAGESESRFWRKYHDGIFLQSAQLEPR